MTGAALAPSRPAGGDDLFPAVPPAEVRGLARDSVRLLVARRDSETAAHARLADLPAYLRPGDVLVANASAVVPASLPAARPGSPPLRLHLSTALGADRWLVEPRLQHGDASRPFPGARAGERLALPAGGHARLVRPFERGGTSPEAGTRLWVAEVTVPQPLHAYLARHGRPIRYGDPVQPWPLAAYQTTFAAEPGSAESPSAGRGFTPRLLRRLERAGVVVTTLVLHTGVSSQTAGEPPYPERYRVPAATAEAVNAARAAGGRVVAVGTTATRALETVAAADGTVHPGEGWTDVVVTPRRGVRVVDGLLSGWHEPAASHLLLLEAVAGRQTLTAAYAQARAAGYHGHEFGDLLLVLPG